MGDRAKQTLLTEFNLTHDKFSHLLQHRLLMIIEWTRVTVNQTERAKPMPIRREQRCTCIEADIGLS